MNSNLLMIAIILQLVLNSLSTNPILTSWKQSSGSKKTFNNIAYETDITEVYYSNSTVFVLTEGIPSHSIGPWLDGTTPSGQNMIYTFPLEPSQTVSKVDLTAYLGPIGAFINGVPIYSPYDGTSYNNLSIWHKNAYYSEYNLFDNCLGHADSSGVYHNHAFPKCIASLTNSNTHSSIIGYAFDGYPIYGPYAYSNATNSSSPIKLLSSSYQICLYFGTCIGLTTRYVLGNGSFIGAGSLAGPSYSTYPAGTFIEDYFYSPGSSDLDACNGRYGVTPDYPNGTYAYFMTVNSSSFIPQYPYVIGTCFYGQAIFPNGKNVTLPSIGLTKFFNIVKDFIDSNDTNFIKPFKKLNLLLIIFIMLIFIM